MALSRCGFATFCAAAKSRSPQGAGSEVRSLPDIEEMSADLSGDVDYTMILPDVYQPPPMDYGAYVLEEPEPDPVHETSEQMPSDERMRGWMPAALRRGAPPFGPRNARRGGKEGFRGKADNALVGSTADSRYWRKQWANIPAERNLKSSRRGYLELENVDWDERPPGFRPDDDIYYSDFYPHRDGSQRSPSRTLRTLAQIPTNSQAMSRVEVDQSTVDLRPCGWQMSRAPAGSRDRFAAGGSDPPQSGDVCYSWKILPKMMAAICFLIMALVLAICSVGAAITIRALLQGHRPSYSAPKNTT